MQTFVHLLIRGIALLKATGVIGVDWVNEWAYILTISRNIIILRKGVYVKYKKNKKKTVSFTQILRVRIIVKSVSFYSYLWFNCNKSEEKSPRLSEPMKESRKHFI